MSYTEDPVFQTVQQIRTPSAVEEILSHAWSSWSGKKPRAVQVTPGQTNYKPFERARVMAEATIVPEGEDAAVTVNLFFHVFAKADTARKEAEGYKQNFLPCDLPPVFLIPHWQTVLWTLPNAPNLKELAQLLNPEKFCQLLVPPAEIPPNVEHYPTPKLFRYVPLKRSLLTWENPSTHRRYFAKLLNEADAPRVVRNFQQINEVFERGELGFAVPQIVSYNPTLRTLLMTEVSGTQFTEVMHRVLPEPFAAVGRILARLHNCDLRPETVWTPSKELAVLRRHMKGVKLALPQLTTQLDGAIARLEDWSGQLLPQNLPIHGNLFGDQILYDPNGISIVDWDALSLGDPLYDIGRLIAHLIYIAGREGISPQAVSACIEALVGTYEAETNRPVNRSCLVWHVATQLLLRGKISSLRKLPEGWQTHLAFVVNEAERLLDGQSRYLSLPALDRVVLSEVFMNPSKPVTVLFTGYAHVHFLCFRPIYEQLVQLPGVEVYVSGGVRTETKQGLTYDGAAMYGPFHIQPDRILSVDEIQSRHFDVLFSANKRIIAPLENFGTRIQIFHGVSFRNRGVRPENLAYNVFFLIGPYMRRKFIEAGLLAEDDPRGVPIGFPKTDPLLTGELERGELLERYGLDGKRPILLYAPTGQAHNSLETMGKEVIRCLSETGKYDLLIKPHDHPKNKDIDWFRELAPLENSHTRLVHALDIIPLLYLSDLLITDASSVANEYTLQNRPIVFLDVPQLIEQSREQGAIVDLETWGRRGGLVVEHPEQVEEVVSTSLAESDSFSEIRAAIASDLFYNPGHATEAAMSWFKESFLN